MKNVFFYLTEKNLTDFSANPVFNNPLGEEESTDC